MLIVNNIKQADEQPESSCKYLLMFDFRYYVRTDDEHHHAYVCYQQFIYCLHKIVCRNIQMKAFSLNASMFKRFWIIV